MSTTTVGGDAPVVTRTASGPPAGSGTEPADGPSRIAPRWEWMLVLALAVVSAVSVLIATRHHVEIDPDSVAYVSGARNLAHGHGFADFTGHALTVFPPGYPVLLSIAEVIGVSVWTVGRFLGAFSSFAIVVLAYALLRRHVRSTALIVGGTVLIACSTQLLLIDSSIASDPLFIALTTAFILLLDLIRTSDRGVRSDRYRNVLLAAAGGLVGISFLVRYAASALLVAGVIALFVLFFRDGFWAAVRRVAWFGCTSLVIPLLWIARNAVSDNPDTLGIRVRSYDTPTSLVKGYVHGAASVVLPRSVTTIPSLLFVVVVAALALGLGLPVRRALLRRVHEEGRSLVPLLAVIVVFAGFVLASEKLAGIDKSARQLLPIWPAFVTVGAVYLGWIAASRRPGWHRRAFQAVIVLAVVFVVISVAWFGRQLGPGTPTYYVAGSASAVRLRQAVDAIPRSHLLMSNDPWRIYLETDRQPVELAPIPIAPTFSLRPLTVPTVLAAACKGPVYLIWFDRGPATGTRSVADLVGRQQFRLVRHAPLAGAELYLAEPAHLGRCSTTT